MPFLRNALWTNLTLILAGGFMMASSACSSIPIISSTYHDAGYRSGEWGGNDLQIVVLGAPFALPPAEFAAAVAEAMQGAASGYPTRFVTASPGADPAYRVVLMFNPPPGAGYNVLCRRPAATDALSGEAASERVQVLVAFCRGDRAMTSAEGWVPTAGGPHSADFKRGINAFGRQLFPPPGGTGPIMFGA